MNEEISLCPTRGCLYTPKTWLKPNGKYVVVCGCCSFSGPERNTETSAIKAYNYQVNNKTKNGYKNGRRKEKRVFR